MALLDPIKLLNGKDDKLLDVVVFAVTVAGATATLTITLQVLRVTRAIMADGIVRTVRCDYI